MKAIILSAGYGTRLSPLTDNTPKPLVEVMGVPTIEYVIKILNKYGVNDFFINTHHMADKFSDFKSITKANFTFKHEKELLGTLGSIFSFKEYLKDEESFIVCNGDVIFGTDIKALLQLNINNKSVVSTMLLNESYETSFDSNLVESRAFNTKNGFMFTGIQAIKPSIFDYEIGQNKTTCIMNDLYAPKLFENRKVQASYMNKLDLWLDMGNMDNYIETNRVIEKMYQEKTLDSSFVELINEYKK